MDLTHQPHTLDPALKASRARRTALIRLLVNDNCLRLTGIPDSHVTFCLGLMSKRNLSLTQRFLAFLSHPFS